MKYGNFFIANIFILIYYAMQMPTLEGAFAATEVTFADAQPDY